jgi:hypothetical protein
MPSLPYSLEALLLGRSRSIEPLDGGDAIVPDVTISEVHDDEVTVTQHPVDTGAAISDHAIVQPASVTCVFGWSDSSRALNSALDGSILKGMQTSKDVYDRLVELKNQRALLRLSTGKRKYPSVVITKLKVSTTVDTESAAVIEVTFQEVFLVEAKTVSLAAIRQKNPRKTASKTSGGSRSAVPVDGYRSEA